ncbi:UDP-glucose dehydrogenase family protein [Priestia aryabhattai]
MTKRITVVGTGYVGLVSGVSLAEIGHKVTCIDIDKNKVNKLNQGVSPIYEPGLEELMVKNIKSKNIHFTTSYEEGFANPDVIYIAVGTPQKGDGSADLTYIKQVCENIAQYLQKDGVVIVTKSTVPVGTNDQIKEWIKHNLNNKFTFDVVSNPEFLREGTAIQDTFHGDRIIIGSDNERASIIIEEINKPFNIPVFKTDIRSAEMIKYASNAFLATKISFINEIANICEKTNANIEAVSLGMGMDERIGSQFLRAGIGYGGSCFPKDTQALIQIAGNVEHEFNLLKAVINVNNEQQIKLVNKAIERFGNLRNKNITLLGLAFKPETDDMRESPSIVISKKLNSLGAHVRGYDPISIHNAKKLIPYIECVETLEDAITGSDMVFILTDWEEFKNISLNKFSDLMVNPIVFDGRNCYELKDVKMSDIEYHSIGRPSIIPITQTIS